MKALRPEGSTNCLHNFLATASKEEQRSSEDLLKQEQKRFQSAASAHEGQAAPLTDIATDLTKAPVNESKITG